jgi:hypothetical protein
MGVMACRRNGCKEIMCNTYVEGIGYVCGECQAQFNKYLRNKYGDVVLKSTAMEELKYFLDTPKFEGEDEEISTDYAFNEVTKRY